MSQEGETTQITVTQSIAMPQEGDTSQPGALPAGWRSRRTEDGLIYYLNDSTKITQWEKPQHNNKLDIVQIKDDADNDADNDNDIDIDYDSRSLNATERNKKKKIRTRVAFNDDDDDDARNKRIHQDAPTNMPSIAANAETYANYVPVKQLTPVVVPVIIEQKKEKVSRGGQDVMLAKSLALSLAAPEKEERKQREMINNMDAKASQQRSTILIDTRERMKRALAKLSNTNALEASPAALHDIHANYVSVDEEALATLPDGWRAGRTEDGLIFYMNDITKTTQWEKPQHTTLNVRDKMKGALAKLSIASASEASPVIIPQNTPTATNTHIAMNMDRNYVPVIIPQNTPTNTHIVMNMDRNYVSANAQTHTKAPSVVIQCAQQQPFDDIDSEPFDDIDSKTRHRRSTIGDETLQKRSYEENAFIFLGILLAIAAMAIDLIDYLKYPESFDLVSLLQVFLALISFLIMVVDYNTGDCECLRMGLMITACLWWIRYCGNCGLRAYERMSVKALIGFNVILWVITAFFDYKEIIERFGDGISFADWILFVECAVGSLGFFIAFGNLLVKILGAMIKCICKLICAMICFAAITAAIVAAISVNVSTASNDCDSSYYDDC